MAKKKINKEQLGNELMELMDVSAPMYLFDPMFFGLGEWIPDSVRIEELIKRRGLWNYGKRQSLFDAIEENYGKRAVEIIKILLSN